MTRRSAGQEEATRPVWLVPTDILEKTTAVVITCAMITGIATEPDPPTAGYLAYGTGAAGIVLARHRWLVGLVLVVAAPLVAVVLGSEPVALWSITSFMAFLLALRGAPAVLTGVVTALGNAAAQWLTLTEFTATAVITPGIAALTAVAATAVGSAVRGNNRYWLALEQRARDAEAGRELEVRRSVAEERLRIARDLHDSVGHAAAVVSMRLGAAEVQLPQEASGARAELAAARGGVQDILREMQQILEGLRVGGEADELAPTPDAGRIAHLVETARAAGLTVDADLGDLSRPLPAHVGAAAYRIVQESLTNAQKHGAGSVHVLVDVDDDALRIAVTNPVEPAAPERPGATAAATGLSERAVGGHGLVGMRERAAAAGGRLEVQRDGGTFEVCADLPVRGRGAR